MIINRTPTVQQLIKFLDDLVESKMIKDYTLTYPNGETNVPNVNIKAIAPVESIVMETALWNKE